MNFSEKIKELGKPFKPSDLKWRIGSKSKDKTKANMLIYVDARTVQDRLDEVLGCENWMFETRSMKSNATVKKADGSKELVEINTIVGRLGIYDEEKDRWIWKEDGAENTEVEASKGGISDAFKRAAVQFGIGRYLYDASEYNTWVSIKNDFTAYEDNKSELDRIAIRLNLRYYHNKGLMEDYLLSLNENQLNAVQKLLALDYGTNYDTMINNIKIGKQERKKL